MACAMATASPCDESDAWWYAGMVAALANGTTPVLQDVDEAGVWDAIGGGHDDVVVYDRDCAAFAFATHRRPPSDPRARPARGPAVSL